MYRNIYTDKTADNKSIETSFNYPLFPDETLSFFGRTRQISKSLKYCRRKAVSAPVFRSFGI